MTEQKTPAPRKIFLGKATAIRVTAEEMAAEKAAQAAKAVN